MTTFLIGADPEIFVTKDDQGISAHDMIPGSKRKPFPVTSGAIQPDGVAAEFNITPVPLGTGSNEYSSFTANIEEVMSQLTDYVKKDDASRKLSIKPVMDFDPMYLDSLPEEAKTLGCDPDFNAYTGEANPTPDAMAPFRTAAGHIHIGWGANIPVDNEEHFKICQGFIKIMDATLGMYMTIIDVEGGRRRDLYGKAGAFRPKSYGVEYRTPSNVWLTNIGRRRAVFEWTHYATVAAQQQYTVKKLTGCSEEAIQKIINEGDWASARVVLSAVVSRLYLSDTEVFRNTRNESLNREKMEKRAKEGFPSEVLADKSMKSPTKAEKALAAGI